jgi:hypothetical protein
MKASRASQQLSDLFTYLLIPGVAVLVPASASRWMLRRVSRWQWFMAAAADSAFQGAQNHLAIEDEKAFKKRWKQVELLDVRDLYMIMSGRSKAVIAEIERCAAVELVKDHVIIGMHWGPSTSIIKLLQVEGFEPALPYRPPEKHILRIRPFYYLFSTIAARYLVKTMGERAVPVGGASKVLRAMMDQTGSVIVVMDAPPMEGRPTLYSTVLGKKAIFNAGFPDILAEKEKEYVFYAISLQADDSVTKKLEIEGPFSSDEAQEFIRNYAEFLDRHLSSDPTQWRIWQVARQFLKEEA